MNYKEYFILCRDKWKEDHRGTMAPKLESFYNDPARPVATNTFGADYQLAVDSAAQKVFDYFSNSNEQGIMINYPDIWSIREQLETMSNYIAPYLENTMHGCYLYVDKIYVYRTTKCERDSSYIWHYDNNPDEIVKNIIYLNNVDENNSPFEYLSKPNGRGYMFNAHRVGPDRWHNAPNGSRVNSEVKKLSEAGHKPVKITGPKGTAFTFNNNTCHRANPITEGYRDVINIRVKPSLNRIDFINKKYTTSFEKAGVVNPNPEKIYE
jgi:hypothetical protein